MKKIYLLALLNCFLLYPSLLYAEDCLPAGAKENRLDLAGNSRYYFSYVPKQHKCDSSAPIWIEFHGVAGFAPGSPPETLFAQDDFIDLAEKNGAILLRFRGVMRPGTQQYAWDHNVDESIETVNRALKLLKEKHAYNPQKIFAFGFSNGTNFAFNLIQNEGFEGDLAGVANFAGGPFKPTQFSSLKDSKLRFYGSSGVRDAMTRYLKLGIELLETAALPPKQIQVVYHLGNHNISRTYLEKAINFLLKKINLGSEVDVLGSDSKSLLSNKLITGYAQSKYAEFAVTEAGELFLKETDPESAWKLKGLNQEVFQWIHNFTDICFLNDGLKLLISGAYGYRAIYFNNIIQTIISPSAKLWFNDTIFINGKWLQVGDQGIFAEDQENLGQFNLRSIAPTNVDLYSIAANNVGTIAISGTNGYLAISKNNGLSFERLQVEGSGIISKVFWQNKNLLVVTGSNGQIFNLRFP